MGLYKAIVLQRSLVLRWSASLGRDRKRIAFGTRKDIGRIEAHAWVEIKGFVLNVAAMCVSVPTVDRAIRFGECRGFNDGEMNSN
jgi:hypothetical protein